MTGNTVTVTVDYREDDGWHIFTSRDVFGLYVARRDRVRAFNEVPRALSKLALLNDKADREYQPEITAEEFFQRIERLLEKQSCVSLLQQKTGKTGHAEYAYR